MSSTGRGSPRQASDYYPTPAWCVHRLLERLRPGVELPGGRWYDPCAGDGAIIRAVDDFNEMPVFPDHLEWYASEIRKQCLRPLRRTVGLWPNVEIMDFLGPASPFPNVYFDLILTNPPFSKAMEFVEMARMRAEVVAMLLRLSFLESGNREAFWRREENQMHIFVLPDRPVFSVSPKTRKPGTDSCAYAWFVWGLTPRIARVSGYSSLAVLRATDSEVRIQARRDVMSHYQAEMRKQNEKRRRRA